jgi:hypothetical protein
VAETSIAKQWQKVQEADAEARRLWDKAHRETKKLARLAKLGRKAKVTIPISDSRGLRIVNRYRTREDRIFTRAFCHRYEVKEVPLDAAD